MRKFFQKIHLWLSIPFGIIITIICLSGAVLVFEQEITHALNPQIYSSEQKGLSMPLPPSQLAKRIKEQTKDSLTLVSLEISGNEGDAVFAKFQEFEKKQLSIDPYTGEVNGWTVSYPFFQTMRKLHRWLMNPPASKGESSAGKTIVGVSTIVMTLILFSGIVIWVPRSLKAVRNRLKVSVNKGWKRFWYDSHVSVGIYTSVFLLIMALTGLTWSFRWYRNFAYGLFESHEAKTAIQSGHPGNNGHPGKEKNDVSLDFRIWDNVLAEIKKEYPEYKSITLGVKDARVIPTSISHHRKADSITFDSQSGKIKNIDRYSEQSVSTKLKGLFYSFHTGTWGGWATKIIYFLSALAGGIFPLTGYYLWLKRKRYFCKGSRR